MVQYRMDLLLWTIAGLLQPLITMALWIATSRGGLTNLNPDEVIFYYLTLAVVSQFVLAWHGFYLVDDILTGKIVKNLIRPVGVLWHSIANNISEKLMKIPIVGAVMIVLFFVLGNTSSIVASITPYQFLLFSISVMLAFIVTFALETITGVAAFWIEDALEIQRYKFLIETVASGVLVPYAFMPQTLATVLSFLPFRYMFAVPVEILLGEVAGMSISTAITVQAAWGISLACVLVFLWKRGLKQYAVPGQ